MDKQTVTFVMFNLDSLFNNGKIRLCDINGIKHASILDIINGVCDGQAKSKWFRLKQDHPDMVEKTYTYKFQGSVGTPVASSELLVQIIFMLPGKQAASFRKSGVQSLLKVLNPDQEFIDHLKNRYDAQSIGQPVGSFLIDSDKVVTLAALTHFYVRVRLPAEYLKKDLPNIKQMTTGIIKIGITYSIQDRNASYLKDPDNGYMPFSFPCNTRAEAEVLEAIIKIDFQDIKVLNSREYIDSARLAEILGVTPFSVESYDDYMRLARELFMYMVRRIKATWPDRYPPSSYGYIYNIIENTRASLEQPPPLEVELIYPCREISDKIATDMGLVLPDTNTNTGFLLRKTNIINKYHAIVINGSHISWKLVTPPRRC